MRGACFALSLLLLAPRCHTQQTTTPAISTTVVVLGSPVPVPEQESVRSTVTLDAYRYALASQSLDSYLRTDASVDIQQRAGNGVMADVSVRGASFAQTLVLLNGFRMSNAETAHFNLDMPVPLHAVGSVDVLHGAGSTLYGADAVGGVVNFTTWKPEASTVELSTGAGSFGGNEQGALLSGIGRKWSEVVAGDRGFSSGFISGRDFRTENASSETRFDTRLGTSDLLLAGDERKFGASQFFGPYASWEHTKGWFASLTQHFTPSTQAAIAYRRHSDIYLLEKTRPLGYKNQHIDDGYQGSLRDHRSVTRELVFATGLEAMADGIDSTNLGRHGRNRGAGYAQLQWLRPGRGSISAGVREEIFSGGRSVFSPTVAASRWVTSSLSVYGSAGYGFRIPTYLDLYYSDPTTRGNANLQPESAWNYEGGVRWFPASNLSTAVTVFYTKQQNTIDYTRSSSAEPWRAANLPGVHFTGVEATAEWTPALSQRIRASWTNLTGAQAALRGLQSVYVFNYPVNNARVEWTWVPSRWLVIQNRLGVLQRFKKDPYAIWDMSLIRKEGRLHPYLRLSNLLNTGYEEIAGVRMPGRGIVGGLEIRISRQ